MTLCYPWTRTGLIQGVDNKDVGLAAIEIPVRIHRAVRRAAVLCADLSGMEPARQPVAPSVAAPYRTARRALCHHAGVPHLPVRGARQRPGEARSHCAGCSAQGTLARHRHQSSGADRRCAGRFAPAQFRLCAEGQAARQSAAWRRCQHGGLCAQRFHRYADARIQCGLARGCATADLPRRHAHGAAARQ